MANYKLDDKKKEEFQALIEKGIGYNIPYAKGTFAYDEKTKKLEPQPEKFKKLYKDFMSKAIQFITIEGGKRGGKDVYGLWCWANYLMSCPDKLHIATGQTINHAISTILKADGFGLEFLLPHGEKVMIDNNPIYRFMDWYGVTKEVRFFAGGEISDCEKFRGMNFGSAYCNEAIKQHINTIKECKDRTIASKWRKIIHTQNPLAGNFGYYEEYEAPLTLKIDDLPKVLDEKNKYEQNAKKLYQVLMKNYALVKTKITNEYVSRLQLSSINDLKSNREWYEKFNLSVRDACYNIEKQVLAKTGLKKECFEFDEYYPNPNGVRNGLYFRYYHFDMNDNLAMTDEERQVIRDTSDTTSIQYRRDILGIRASADNAVFDTFTSKNIIPIEVEIPNVYSGDRYLAIDYGMKNDFVVLDCEVLPDFTCIVWKEYRVNGRQLAENNGGEGNYLPPTNSQYAEDIKKMIFERNGGNYVTAIIDPSATGLINEMIIKGIAYKKAKNDVGVKPKDKPDKRVDKSLTGIWLVRDGFAKCKIKVHESCRETINEIYGYALDPKKLLVGIEEPIKVRDHGCLVGESLIQTNNGLVPIKDLKSGDVLLTLNETTNEMEYDTIDETMLTRKDTDVYELELENGMKLQLTADHKVFTQNGRKQVKDLLESDVIMSVETQVEYKNDTAYFGGYKFKKDKRTGYYLSTMKIDGNRRQRLHRYVWSYYNGKIPEGYQVHHKDFNKDNNSIDNLQLLNKQEHLDLHGKSQTPEQRERARQRINEIRHKAIEWHKSSNGLKWHSEHAKRQSANWEYKDYTCLNCGKSFKSRAIQGAMYCCNNCKASYRRKRLRNETNKDKIN